MIDTAYKWIIGILMLVLVAVSGYAYTSLSARVARNEKQLDTSIPILYRIEAKVDNIEKILKVNSSP